MHKVLVVPSKSLFLWGLSILLLTPQVGISTVDPRTFATVQELLWYNCSPVYGRSARRLYSGANGDLLLEDLCHRPQPPGLLQLEPLALRQVPDDPRLRRTHSNTQRQVWLSLLWSHCSLPGSQCAQGLPSKHLWKVWDLILNTILPFLPSCWGFFALGHGASFFGGIQDSPWKKSYDKPREHITKQRYHFADKGLYSHSYGFSSSCVQMWDLGHEEGWVLKNWCFWTVVLEKTLESPLDHKIKPINPKGNQHWIFTGRTDAEAASNSNTLATWCKDSTHWKIPWCWERLKAKREGDGRGRDD